MPMFKTIRLVNKSGGPLTCAGLVLPTGNTYITLDNEAERQKLAFDSALVTAIGNGNVIVNDGVADLTATAGLFWLQSTGELSSSNTVQRQVSVVAASASLITLTATSKVMLILTGTFSGQQVRLPNATTLGIGHMFIIHNNTTGTVVVQVNSGATLVVLQPRERVTATYQADGSTNGIWSLDIVSSRSSASSGAMPVYFGGKGDTGNAYMYASGSSALTSDLAAEGFPRPVKIVGYFLSGDRTVDPNRAYIVRIRELLNLGVDKFSISKGKPVNFVSGWDDNGYTTFAAGERIAAYIEKNPDNSRDPRMTLWYVWND